MHPQSGTLVRTLTLSLAATAALAAAHPGYARTQGGETPPSPVPAQGEPVPAPVVPSVPPATEPATVKAPLVPVWEPKYHDLASVQELLRYWSTAPEGSTDAIGAVPSDSAAPKGLRVERLELGPTRSGLQVSALRVGSAEGGPLAQRPTLVLLGGLDGTSLTGCEAVLAVLAHVFEHPGELPPGTCILAVPWAAPEALQRTLEGTGDGRDLRPIDDDGDRRADEDGPDDLDGDGQILELLIEDPDGPWTRGADPRFLVPAKPGDGPRYRRMPEGKDDDGDGLFNEDPVGGEALAQAFPDGFVPAGSLITGLSLPLEDEHARSLCALLAESHALAVLALQGDHGELATVALEAPPERASAELVARCLARPGMRAEERPRLLAEFGREPFPGSALRWMRGHLGGFVAEYAPWGPDVERTTSGATASPAGARRDGPGLASASDSDPRLELERAWARWLDDTRGGIGFLEWHPVDLGPGRRALVGGWMPFTRRNAPEVALAGALGSVPAGILRLLAQFPRLEPVFTEVRRDGELCFLRARITNRGGLACAPCPGGGPPLRARLVLGSDARLVAGSAEVDLEALAGGASTREFAWIVLAPPQSAFRCRVELPWGGAVEQEVRP